MKISRKNRYISDLVWEKDHFETELKKSRPWSETGKFPWIYYLGDRFTVTQARARIKELTAEIEHVQSDDSYTPWKDDFDFEKHTIEDIKRNLDEQEIPEEGISPQQMEAIKDGAVEVPDCSPAGEPVRELPTDPDTTYPCPSCGKPTINWGGSGVCQTCDEDGIWIDPAGGIHTDDEEDPAAQYE